jgi:16S rRNA (guanine1207-N2)-methyltransferase
MVFYEMSYYFSEHQDSEVKLNKIRASLINQSFEFYTGSGIFSKDKIDMGTGLLINCCIVRKSWRVLDLGCGYGAVGISIAKVYPDTDVVMVDINRRAVKLAKLNAKLNGVGNTDIYSSNLFEEVDKKFDTIIVNPPQKAGKDICFRMIEQSKQYLEKGGLLQLVARHNKGGKSLAEKMEGVFHNMKSIAKKSGYRIYVSSIK